MAVHDARDDDPRLGEVRDLTDAEARRLVESEHGCFVAEGLRTLESVVAHRHRIRLVLTDDTKLDRVLDVLGDQREQVDVHVGSRALLESVTGFPIHRGVVASVDRPAPPAPVDLVRGATTVLVVEGVNDHENVGALFRAAAAFAVDAVLLDDRSADPLYRRAVRVSLGHVLGVPWTRVPTTDEAISLLRSEGIASLALTPAGDVSVHDVGRGRWAWLVGAEGPGLAHDTLDRADRRVRIPITSGVDSLNVATAAAIALAVTAPVPTPP